MTIATLILIVLAAGLLVYAWQRGDGSHRRGLRQAWETTKRTGPLILVAFAITGYVSILLPQDVVRAWMGPTAGLSGIVLGEGVGMLLPGGPYVVLPLVRALYDAGIGLAAAITIVVSWSILTLTRLAFEVPFMGWRFTAVRWGIGLFFPLLAGVLVLVLFSG